MPYHIHPATGEPGFCRASRGSCPFSPADEHYPTREAAQAAFEAGQTTFHNRTKDQPMRLSEIMDLDLLNKMIEGRYILTSAHPEDESMKILTYGTLAQIEGKWNAATTAARGLIVRHGEADFSDAVVLERPWEKFFTLSQRESGWHLGDEENSDSDDSGLSVIDFDAPAKVYDKADGSLGILYRGPDGLPAFATKGSFISEQAKFYTKLLRSDENKLEAAEHMLKAHPDKTILTELIGPGNRIVVAYKEADIVLLGASLKKDASNVSPEEINADWSARGLTTVEAMPAKTLREALALPARENKEGVVVSIEGERPMKIKIKQDDYVRLHRMVTMFSKRESRNMVMFDVPATVQDFLDLAEDGDLERFPKIKEVLNIEGFKKSDQTYEFIRGQREAYFKDMLMPRAKALAEAKAVIDGLDSSWFDREDAKKNFAANVKNFKADTATLFQLFDAKLKGKKPSEIDAQGQMKRAAIDVKDQD